MYGPALCNDVTVIAQGATVVIVQAQDQGFWSTVTSGVLSMLAFSALKVLGARLAARARLNVRNQRPRKVAKRKPRRTRTTGRWVQDSRPAENAGSVEGFRMAIFSAWGYLRGLATGLILWVVQRLRSPRISPTLLSCRQKAIAAEIGMSERRWGDITQGRTRPRKTTAAHIALEASDRRPAAD